MKVLIIEDSDYKVEHLTNVINEVFPAASIRVARSFNTGIALALSDRPEIVLLDMSLPTFEVGHREAGGRTRPFGGREILRELDMADINSRVIIVTQFDQFGDGKRSVRRDDLISELRRDFPFLFMGVVYYNGTDSQWKRSLIDLLKNLPGL